MKISFESADAALLQDLGERLMATRLGRNWTQAQLAQEAGVSKRTVERLESGEVAVQLTALVRVLRALGLLENLNLLVPEVGPSPIQELKLRGQRRRRASGSRRGEPSNAGQERSSRSGAAGAWKWGDEA